MVTSVCAYITTATRVGHTDKTCNRGTMSKEASCQIIDLLCQSDTIEFLLYTGEDDLIKKIKIKIKNSEYIKHFKPFFQHIAYF